ncbi:MAG: isocitrate dehydrogenase kinase/phosphatase AceK regulatory subunit, partial [Thermoanaerobaculia bacterium]
MSEERAETGAEWLLRAYEEYTRAFGEITRRAPARFSGCDWHGTRADALERLELYRKRLDPAIRDLESLFGGGVSDVALWRAMKTLFARFAADRQDLELAETFFNSASRRIFHTVGVDSRAEFVSSEPPALPLDAAAAFLVSFDGSAGTRATLERALSAMPFAAGWEDLACDAALGAAKLDAALTQAWGAPLFDSLEMLRPVFFRSKGAYLIGRVRRGDRTRP